MDIVFLASIEHHVFAQSRLKDIVSVEDMGTEVPEACSGDLLAGLGRIQQG